MKNFKYKTLFSSTIKCIIDDEKDKILSMASLDNLKSIIPKEFQNQIDLLPISFNACTVNLGNKNGDMIKSETALEIYKGFISRPINIEHNRSAGAFGHIVSAAFSKFNEKYVNGYGSEIIEASEINGNKNPANISLAGVLYRVYSPDLISEIEKSNDPNSDRFMQISASWELMFNNFDLAVGSKYLENCEIISDEKEVEKNKKYLLGEGGSGKLPDGRPVYRLLKDEVFALGIGLTENAAAEVKGVYTNINNNMNAKKDKTSCGGACPKCGAEMDMEDEMNDNTDVTCAECKNKSKAKNWKIKANSSEIIDKLESIDKKFEETSKNLLNSLNSLSQFSQHVVNSNSNKFMKVKNIKDLTSEMLKEVNASDVQELYAQDLQSKIEAEVKKISEDYEAKKIKNDEAIKAANTQIADLDKSVKENIDKYTELEKKFNEVNENYNKLVKANEEKAKLEVFSARLQTLDEQFNLNEEEKKIVGDELKAIDSDEAFAKYQAKMDVLLAKSKKVFDPKTKKWVNKEDLKDGGKDDSSENPDGTKKTAKASTNVVEEVAKTEKVVTATVPNTSTVTETLADKAKKAFSMDGWESSTSRRKKV